MEEARQHPPLTWEQRVAGAIFGCGLLALFGGLALQLAFGAQFLLIGIIGFGVSRITLAGWEFLRPTLFNREPSAMRSAVAVLGWSLILMAVIFVFSEQL